MSIMAYIDYSFIILFFIGFIGLVWFFTTPNPIKEFEAETPPPLQKNKAAYGFLVVFLVTLFTLALLALRQQAEASS